MRRTSCIIRNAFFALSLLKMSTADTLEPSFIWAFDDTPSSSELVQCSQLGLRIGALDNGLGTPPYYMIAIVPNGIPTTTFIGADPSNLSWQINYLNGTQFLPMVVDANGNSGGSAHTIFSVAGGDTSCLSSLPENDLKLVANVSTSEPLETCQPLSLTVQGGTKPYRVTIASSSMPSTNLSLGADSDLTWVNQVAPGSTLIATVSDANGWGTSTGFFGTTGSSNTTCRDLISIPVDATAAEPRSSQSPSSTTDSKIQSMVDVSSQSAPGSHSTQSTRSVLSTQSTRLTQPALSTQSMQPAHSTQSAQPVTLSAGRAVAAVSGVTVATILCMAALLCYYRRRRQPRTSRFALWPVFQPDARPVQRSNGSAAGTEERFDVRSSGSLRDSRRDTTTLEPGHTNTALLPLNRSSHLATDSSIVIQHEDAGDITELPPPYRDVRGRANDRLAEGATEVRDEISRSLVCPWEDTRPANLDESASPFSEHPYGKI